MIKHRDTGRTLTELADAAFAAAAEDVIRRARESNTDIVIWRDGAIAHVSPDEFERQRAISTQPGDTA